MHPGAYHARPHGQAGLPSLVNPGRAPARPQATRAAQGQSDPRGAAEVPDNRIETSGKSGICGQLGGPLLLRQPVQDDAEAPIGGDNRHDRRAVGGQKFFPGADPLESSIEPRVGEATRGIAPDA